MRGVLLSLLIPSFSVSLRVPSGHTPQLLQQAARNRHPGIHALGTARALSTSMSLRGGGGASPGHIVSAEWLRSNLAAPSVKVLDASWYLYPHMERSPGVPFDAHMEFSAKRIPGALYFDIDKVCVPDSPWPHMMPSAKLFAECVAALGISRDSHVVVYDGYGQFSSARAWYMFKAFGHKDVSILDGGMPAWERAGGELEMSPLDAEAKAEVPGKYECEQLPNTALSMDEVEANIKSKARQLIDGRPRARWLGEAKEPRPIESGHIEGSFSVPWGDVVRADGTFKDEKEIRQILQDSHVDLSKPVAVTCGSGVSACVVAAALASVGVTEMPLYDGAYTEWKSSGKETFKGTDKACYIQGSERSKL
mmetsp:Transcript_32198/g.78979  ORF Transcript_32198/g.78979 Transcript_32198/m.78979 type:complete len:365 (+) Transcript_32198:167-1261(+)